MLKVAGFQPRSKAKRGKAKRSCPEPKGDQEPQMHRGSHRKRRDVSFGKFALCFIPRKNPRFNSHYKLQPLSEAAADRRYYTSWTMSLNNVQVELTWHQRTPQALTVFTADDRRFP